MPGGSANPGADETAGEARAAILGERLAVAAIGVLLVIWAGAFAYHFLPFIQYRYEADPSDGDMLNALMRGLAGKPIYGDWKAGTVTLLYPPLFLGVLGLARAIGLDPIVFCRSANLGFFLLSLGLVAVVASGHAEGRRRVSVPGLLGGIFMLSAWKQYFWMAPIHPAALLLAISVVTCAILAFRPAATVPLALCGSIAVLAKQSGIGLLVAVLVHVAITDRKRLLRFCVVAGVALGLAVAMFELQSQGQFLRSVFFYPGRIFTGQWASWDKASALAAGFYGGRLWLLPLVALGLVSAWRTWLFPLAVVFGVDAVAELYLARSVAGSPSYLWFHFALACILAAQGWRWLLARAGQKLRPLARARLLPVLSVLLAFSCLAVDGRDLLRLPRQDLSRASEISRRHAQVVASLVTANPDKKWIITRSSLAAVRSGVILDQEYATFAIAWTHPTLLDRLAIRQRVAAGEYTFAQLAPTGLTFDPLADIFAACFSLVSHSTLVYMGRSSPAAILRYDGARPQCQNLRP